MVVLPTVLPGGTTTAVGDAVILGGDPSTPLMTTEASAGEADVELALTVKVWLTPGLAYGHVWTA